jgi:hypothetical protein
MENPIAMAVLIAKSQKGIFVLTTMTQQSLRGVNYRCVKQGK